MSATHSPSSADQRPFPGLQPPTRYVADLGDGVDQQPFSGLHLSSQDVAVLVEGVDFDSPVHVGESNVYGDLLQGVAFDEPVREGEGFRPLPSTSPFSMCHPTSGRDSPVGTTTPERECAIQSLPDKNSEVLTWHVFLARGCKSCYECKHVEPIYWDVMCTNPFFSYNIDFTRPIPQTPHEVGNKICQSFDYYLGLWCGQPRDEYEWMRYHEDMEKATLYNAIEEEYWSVAKNEIDYLVSLESWLLPQSLKRRWVCYTTPYSRVAKQRKV
jgi:hypothetical protein